MRWLGHRVTQTAQRIPSKMVGTDQYDVRLISHFALLVAATVVLAFDYDWFWKLDSRLQTPLMVLALTQPVKL